MTEKSSHKGTIERLRQRLAEKEDENRKINEELEKLRYVSGEKMLMFMNKIL